MPRIIHKDNEIIVCIKPTGVISQDAGADSMPQLLREKTGCEYIAVLHRLDTAVSGVMVYAKTKAAAAELSAQIQSGAFVKEYLAVVEGMPESPNGILEDLLFKDSSKNKSYVVKRERKGVKRAVLEYETLSTVHLDNGDISLLKIRLYTGRTHQIRVQFASRKMPLLGDKKYGSHFTCPIALFSRSISFKYPKTNKSVGFIAEPDYTQFPWNKFKK